jgi:ferrochelatase
MTRTGVLLINLGTPDAPTPEAVGRYLREFLMDRLVIDVPAPLRWFLVNIMIVPRRKVQSAKAYQKVQLPGGSPLRVYTRALADKVAERLGAVDGRYEVEYAMRYGNPSIDSALEELNSKDVKRVIVMPLYPQYAESSFETAVVETKKRARELKIADRLLILPPFYNRSDFIAAVARRVADGRKEGATEHILFSFHSLPVKHVQRLDQTRRHCLIKADCCDEISAVNRNCYRAQCVYTARAIARQLGLRNDEFTISFQSRLGRAEWLGPNTEQVLVDLAHRGVKRIAVSCPSFIADCLETLEEIGIRGRATFIAAGGEELRLIPSLNSEPAWVETIANWIRESNH